MSSVVFQQDGATAHCFTKSLEYLHKHFPGDNDLSSYGQSDTSWPARLHNCTFTRSLTFGLISVGIFEKQGLFKNS